jgi:hypothetical protein
VFGRLNNTHAPKDYARAAEAVTDAFSPETAAGGLTMYVTHEEVEGALAELIQERRTRERSYAQAEARDAAFRARESIYREWQDRLTTAPGAKRHELRQHIDGLITKAQRSVHRGKGRGRPQSGPSRGRSPLGTGGSSTALMTGGLSISTSRRHRDRAAAAFCIKGHFTWGIKGRLMYEGQSGVK